MRVILYYGKTLPSGNKVFSSTKIITGKPMFLEYVPLVLLIVAMTAVIYVFIFIHDIPCQIAKIKRPNMQMAQYEWF